MTDALLINTPDGGTVEFINGTVTMSDGRFNAVYISLFGGNEEDSGRAEDDKVQFWANLLARVESQKLRSRTQNLLRSMPIVPGNLKLLQAAAEADLAWMVDEGFVSSVSALATMPALNTVNLQVNLLVGDEIESFDFPQTGVATQ